ncbi:MAG: class I SAM-dependent methyltransferase [Opitutae bacterium]|nr:class I SAM-dependent methyltransferase [Opitutae bacterium]
MQRPGGRRKANISVESRPMPTDTKITAQHWNDQTARFAGRTAGLSWGDAGPAIHRHINRRISGDPEIDWLAYTADKYFSGRLPLARCLSLGCGTGVLERALARHRVFQQCDAYDVAEGALQEARRLAKENQLAGIMYYAADINAIKLPAGAYDAVWIHHAMHHFESLEHICGQISQSLKPDGLLILNEYVGPSRFQFPARQKEVINLCLGLLPAQYRTVMSEQVELEMERTPLRKGPRWLFSRLFDKIRDGDLIDVVCRRLQAYRALATGRSPEMRTIVFPSRRDIIRVDPSEAVRSEEIEPVLQSGFEILEKKDWGGNVLQFLLQGIAGRFSANDPRSQDLVSMLTVVEDTLLQCGEFESDFAYIVARPKAACGHGEAGNVHP